MYPLYNLTSSTAQRLSRQAGPLVKKHAFSGPGKSERNLRFLYCPGLQQRRF